MENKNLGVDETRLREIGRLQVQIIHDEAELENLNKCAGKIAEKLRVVAACLDPSDNKVKASSFPEKGVFTSQHPKVGDAILPTFYNVDGRGYGFEIPERQPIEDMLKRIHQLDSQIASNRKRAEIELKRQAEKV